MYKKSIAKQQSNFNTNLFEKPKKTGLSVWRQNGLCKSNEKQEMLKAANSFVFFSLSEKYGMFSRFVLTDLKQ